LLLFPPLLEVLVVVWVDPLLVELADAPFSVEPGAFAQFWNAKRKRQIEPAVKAKRSVNRTE
jgi:hypothetical protein